MKGKESCGYLSVLKGKGHKWRNGALGRYKVHRPEEERAKGGRERAGQAKRATHHTEGRTDGETKRE